ncbi:MAG: hypothetical protein V4623_01550 [Pseudomonadota bacterium]
MNDRDQAKPVAQAVYQEVQRNRLFADELNEMVMKELRQRQHDGLKTSALLFGRDMANLAYGAAKLGVQVVLASHDSALQDCTNLRILPVPAVQGAVPVMQEAPFDVIVGQFVLHTVPYEAAKARLKQLLGLLKIGGKLYLSAYGLHSTLGDHYPDSGKLVKERFAAVPQAIATLYDVHGEICLYSERNLISLMFELGASVLHSATGALGNVRAVAVRI